MPSTKTRLLAVALLCLTLWSLPGAAQAQSAETVDRHQRARELYYRGRYADAEIMARKAVKQSEAEFGPNNPNTAQRLSTLAKIFHALERYGEAETLYIRILLIFEKTVRPADPNIVDTLNMLASLYRAQGRLAEAEPLYKRSLAIIEKGSTRGPWGYEARMGLGELYLDQGRYAEVEALLKPALAETPGYGVPYLLALAYSAQGHYAEAEPLFERASMILEKTLGPDHPEFANLLSNLVENYIAQGRYVEAEPLIERALKILEAVHGPDHPEVAALLSNLVENYIAQGRYADGRELAAWAKIKNSGEVPDFEAFLRDHPQGRFADQAKKVLASLRPSPEASTPASPVLQAAGAHATPGKTFKDCAKCPEMVVVPAGSFQMGMTETERQVVIRTIGVRKFEEYGELYRAELDKLGPQHRVNFGYSFAVGRYEVTFAEWDACVSVGGCSHRPNNAGGRGRHPVVGVSWNHAKEYVLWLSRKTGRNYRLLSEAEWEYVARAGTLPHQPGSATIPDGNYGRKTVPVGSFPANAFGLQDMLGNAREWVDDCWHNNYVGAPSDGSAWGECGENARILRGRAYPRGLNQTRWSGRFGIKPSSSRRSVGFRVARTLQ